LSHNPLGRHAPSDLSLPTCPHFWQFPTTSNTTKLLIKPLSPWPLGVWGQNSTWSASF
jgi:hypothetical protein